MKRLFGPRALACGASLSVFCLSCVFGQQRPLVTESAETVAEHHLRIELGAEILRDAVFPLSGLAGDLTRFGVFGLRFGIGPAAEIQVQGVAQDYLSIEDRLPAPHSSLLDVSGNSTTDFGDLVLGAKVRFVQERENRPAIAFRFAVELPNASNESGLGNDETNAYGGFLVSKTIGRAKVAGNLGVAILGDPLDAASQDDLFTFGLSGVYAASPRLNLVAEAYGRTGPGGIGTEEQTRLRAGLQTKAGGFYWDAGVFAGFRTTDPSWGLVFGVSREFRFD
ncbi:MAG: hypothetical protein EHM61_15590 [Acidobacteria bacterium]|nr:MAG: hypothetical protein EHM61_15590 [Acidobacteriota bacterium]